MDYRHKEKETLQILIGSLKELANSPRHHDIGGITILLHFKKFRIMKGSELNVSVWKSFS